MAEAARIVRTLDRPTWILAHEQSAARGRRGRAWDSPKGNFAATLISRPQATAHEAAKRSFLAANALFESLAFFVSRERLSLKWPNDVLLDDCKVAGILLESAGGGHFVDWLAIGIGVNLRKAPPPEPGAAFTPISLIDAGADLVLPEDFLTVLASNMATQEGKWDTFGFPRIREDWLRHAARLGEEIVARTGKETVRGLFDTVDQDGNLILITARGPRSIPAADVYFPAP